MAEPLRPERDGCGCPPWVLRCAHWEGKVLMFIDRVPALAERGLNVVGPCPGCGRPLEESDPRLFAVLGPGVQVPEQSTCVCRVPLATTWSMADYFVEEVAAHAEFERRERILLGREEE